MKRVTRCSVEDRASWPRELPCRHRRHRRRRVHSDLSVAMCGSTLICIFGYRMAAKERKRAAVQRLWWQRLRRQRLCIAKLAEAPQALVIVGACTARGRAQAPRARQFTGCRHLLYSLKMAPHESSPPPYESSKPESATTRG